MKENDADYVVLVIKKPSCCWECRFEHFGLCMATKERYSIKYLNAIPALCPLKPLPERKEVHYTDPLFGEVENLTNIGYNKCLDDLGETE